MSALNTILDEYVNVVDSHVGLYLDALDGFACVKSHVENMQNKAISKMGLTLEHLDDQMWQLAEGVPADAVIVHTVTQGRRKQRNSVNGSNSLTIANMFVVLIYQYWEDHYRAEIAAQLGMSKDQLRSDIFGDLRFFRIGIVHRKGKATEDVSNCKILKWFKPDQQIVLDKAKILEIGDHVKKYLLSLRQ